MVEDLDKLVEASLLLQEVSGRGLGSFFFQSKMHAFMPAVLLGMTGLDAFDADTETKPPDGEFAQIEQGVRRSKRHAIIAADVGGQTALFKKPLKYGESIVFPRRRKGLTSEEKTAGMVGDGERITVLAIAEQELPL